MASPVPNVLPGMGPMVTCPPTFQQQFQQFQAQIFFPHQAQAQAQAQLLLAQREKALLIDNEELRRELARLRDENKHLKNLLSEFESLATTLSGDFTLLQKVSAHSHEVLHASALNAQGGQKSTANSQSTAPDEEEPAKSAEEQDVETECPEFLEPTE